MEALFGGHAKYTDKHHRLEGSSKKYFDTNLMSYEINSYWSIRIWAQYCTNRPKNWRAATNGSYKISPKKDQFVTSSIGKKVSSKKLTPLTNLGHQAKQVLTAMSKHQKISINAIQIPSEIQPSLDT